jgi:SPP1 family predicted phage head-tail adaptor
MAAIGTYRHVVTVQAPTGSVADGEGGWTEGWADLTPAEWHVSISPASARDLERVGSGTVITSATHLITGRYRPDVTTATRALFEGRLFAITGVRNTDERNVVLECTAEEQL